MDCRSSDPEIMSSTQKLEVAAPRSRQGFWALIATQFQGAFSDNILRNLLLSMIIGMNLAKSERETFVSVVTFLFSVPFLILSMPGGWLADRFSKRQITIWSKVMEFGSMLLATAGLATHSLGLSLAALTLIASQAALFGPSKYGLLPELLLVKGPNIMRGYLGQPGKTAEVLNELADTAEQVFAVTAVPDEKKGERIIVIHTLPEATLTAVLEKLSKYDLPALWKPKANQFVHVDSIPTLGTGKMDLRAIKLLATSMTAAVEAEA